LVDPAARGTYPAFIACISEGLGLSQLQANGTYPAVIATISKGLGLSQQQASGTYSISVFIRILEDSTV